MSQKWIGMAISWVEHIIKAEDLRRVEKALEVLKVVKKVKHSGSHNAGFKKLNPSYSLSSGRLRASYWLEEEKLFGLRNLRECFITRDVI